MLRAVVWPANLVREPRMPRIPYSGGALVVLNIVCTQIRARTRQDRSPVVVEVSACADIFGAHSAALDSEVRTCAHVILSLPREAGGGGGGLRGEAFLTGVPSRPTCCTRAHQGLVYTWGLGSATGHGTLKPVLTPQRVVDLTAVRSLACGGSCTAALTHDHHLYTWGAWAGGRLGARILANIHAWKQRVCCRGCANGHAVPSLPHTGLGSIPSKSENSYLHQNTRRRLMRFQLWPKEVVVPGDERIARVRACAFSRWHAHIGASVALSH